MDHISWGIIGCGDVTEIKSGPAFSKVPDSSLWAVMRRNEAKARDYAERHQVPNYYSDAAELINDPAVNAIYIATPPGSHEQYCLAALAAGKPVYVEKPMALHHQSAEKMMAFAKERNVKLVVAHYRRAQPYFNKIKALLQEGAIGKVMYVRLDFRRKKMTAKQLQDPKTAWRVDPSQSGGGLFHDLAPHQLGLMLYYFGEVAGATGFSANRSNVSQADDLVSGIISFESGVQFTGSWCFDVDEWEETDSCEIVGTEGSISFAVFDKQQIMLRKGGQVEFIDFAPLPHVQQPMIEKVVSYFLDECENPCPPQEGYEVMKLMDAFTLNQQSDIQHPTSPI